MNVTSVKKRFGVTDTGRLVAARWNGPDVPAQRVVDTQADRAFDVLYTEKQAAFVADYLNDVHSGLVSLTNN